MSRRVNEARYAEFVDMADQHLGEFRSNIPRLAPDTDIDIIEKSAGVERSIGFLLTRLRRSPKLDRSWHDFARLLHEAAERVATLAVAAGSDYVAERLAEVATIIEGKVSAVSPEELDRSPDAFVHTRFAAQTDVVTALRTRGGFNLATIRDDVDRRLAMPYFCIDLALLRRVSQNG